VTTIDHAIEFYVSNDALEAQYVRTLDLGELGPTEVRGGFYYNEDRDLIAIGDVLATVGDDVGARLTCASARASTQHSSRPRIRTSSASVSAARRNFLDSGRTTSVSLALFYAPDIVTFGLADNVTDVSLRLLTRLRNGTDVFVGYRTFEIDMEPANREVDDHLHVGFRRSF
jgi:hypothetical protein